LNELISCAGYARAGEITTTGCAFWCAEVVHAAYIPLAARAVDRGLLPDRVTRHCRPAAPPLAADVAVAAKRHVSAASASSAMPKTIARVQITLSGDTSV